VLIICSWILDRELPLDCTMASLVYFLKLLSFCTLFKLIFWTVDLEMPKASETLFKMWYY